MSNINARYTVDAVKISGIPDARVSQGLRDDLQALVGDRLEAELPGYTVRRRISRGAPVGAHSRELHRHRTRQTPLDPVRGVAIAIRLSLRSGVGGVLDILMGGRDHRMTVGIVGDNDDGLVEEYTGYRVRLESRWVATERVGLSLEYVDFDPTWRDATLAAAALNPRIAEIYQGRQTIAPLVTFALSPHLRVAAGASVTELESLVSSTDSQTASAATLSIGYDQRWERPSAEGAVESSGEDWRWERPSRTTHEVEASYVLRATTTALESDLDYKRQLGQGRYRYRRGHNTLMASVALGRIAGGAPLFERFSLGDSSTLRGWSKFDIAPAGGDRMVHHSLEYRHRGLAFFFDAGSVWDQGTDARLKLATGVGFHGDNGFLTIGFPMNASEVGAQFMAGVRF